MAYGIGGNLAQISLLVGPFNAKKDFILQKTKLSFSKLCFTIHNSPKNSGRVLWLQFHDY